MEIILNVLERLSIDKTIIPTFIIVIGLYLIISNVFFKKLLHVILTREEKTTKLEGSANEKAHEAERLKSDYKDRVNEAYSISQNELKMMKAKQIQEKRDEFLKVEADINSKADEKLNEDLAKLNKKKEEVMASAENLSKVLIDKLT